MLFLSTIGWGLVIYAITSLSWAGFSLYGLTQSPVASVLQLIVLVCVTTIAARSLKFAKWPDVFPYSLTWAGVVAVLDVIYRVPFFGWGYFFDWSLWVTYALIVIVPLITLRKERIVAPTA